MANVNVILDEAASLGPNMGCIEDAIDKYRGYGIRLQLYYQSPAQLKKCFPGDQDQTVLANTTQIFLGVNDIAAEYVSNRLGDQTIVVESGGSGSGYSTQSSNSGGQSNSTYSTNESKNWSQMARRLLKPEEILALGNRIAITFVPGLPPICTALDRYFEKKTGSSQLSSFAVLFIAFCVLSMTSFGSLATFRLVEISSHGRSIQGHQEYRARRDSRTEASGHPNDDGTRLRVVQRPRLRHLRSRPVPRVSEQRDGHEESGNGGASTGTGKP